MKPILLTFHDSAREIPVRTFEVASTETVTLEQLNDLLITAVEGGIGYWSQVDKWGPENYDADIVFARLREIGEKHWREIRSTDFVAILPRLTQESGQVRDAGWTINETLENADAEIADIAVQLVIFGKVVYG
jgi:hypothetical protein